MKYYFSKILDMTFDDGNVNPSPIYSHLLRFTPPIYSRKRDCLQS